MIESAVARRMASSSTTWTTADELAFIERVGAGTVKERRRACLAGYLASVPMRAEWGDIDQNAAEDKARALLAIESR